MKVTRIFTGDDAASHFEDIEVDLDPNDLGAMSKRIAARSMFFRDTTAGGPAVFDFHVAPRTQIIVHLRGLTEIEVGSGETRRFGPGDVLLADDLTGQGHISREIVGPRTQVFVVLEPGVDLRSFGDR